MRFLAMISLAILFTRWAAQSPDQFLGNAAQRAFSSRQDPLPSAKTVTGGETHDQASPRRLSPEKQKVCDGVRARQDRSAEFVCLLLLNEKIADKLPPNIQEYCASLRPPQVDPYGGMVCALLLPDRKDFCDSSSSRGDVGALGTCLLLQNDAVAGGLSTDKQEACDFWLGQKEPDAPFFCAVLLVDMGPEYENLTAHAYALAKPLCLAAGGPLPTDKPPGEPSARARWNELMDVFTKINEAYLAQKNLKDDAEADYRRFMQEKSGEVNREVPHREEPNLAKVHPDEARRFTEIFNKYEPRLREKDAAAFQAKLRLQRIQMDTYRLMGCGKHIPFG